MKRALSPLNRKLLRDTWRLKTQIASIALVLASGISGFVGLLSTHDALVRSRDHFYASARFPDVFVDVKRAPGTLAASLRALPGVTDVETRVVRDVQLDVPGIGPPMVARMVGVEFQRPGSMNRLTLKHGRWPQPGAHDEVLVNTRFAEARSLEPGVEVYVLLNGRRQRLTVVGMALSPETVFVSRGGALPDDEWYGVLWMDAGQLAAAFDMQGAFNSAVVKLGAGASAKAVMADIDRLLEPYGTRGAYGREDQLSHRMLNQEIEEQRVYGTVLPAIFLLVAAFILNTVMHRHVNAQRGEIAALKALGYRDSSIALHYSGIPAIVVALAFGIGIAIAEWFGRSVTSLYAEMFRFPAFDYVQAPRVLAVAALVAVVAGFGGAIAALGGVMRLRPAEALRPPAPEQFRPLLMERLGLAGLFTPSQRMILRNLERRPIRALFTVCGMAGAVAILISGTFWKDAIDLFVHAQFTLAQPAQVYLAFSEPRPRAVDHELARLPGVLQAETLRSIDARLRSGPHSYRTSITGLDEGSKLRRIVDRNLDSIPPSEGSLVLTERLARRLDVRPGDSVSVELMEGRRVQRDVVLAGVSDELAGMSGYMTLDDLNRIAGDGPLVSIAALVVDSVQEPQLFERLKQMPKVASTIVKASLLDSFEHTTARTLLFFTSVLTVFAMVIAVGVVYNNARIQLEERAWELASLRVVGLTRAEVSVLLLGELGMEIAVAVPLGFVLGYGLSALIVALAHGETFDIPVVVLPATYFYAAATVVVAGALSGLIVRHRVDHLDLVAVLKTRE